MSETNTYPQVTFQKSGQTLAWDGSHDNLLELAEEHGIDIPYSCRCGADHICLTKIISGEVAYDMEPLDLPPGECLPCVARPAGDVTLDA